MVSEFSFPFPTECCIQLPGRFYEASHETWAHFDNDDEFFYKYILI